MGALRDGGSGGTGGEGVVGVDERVNSMGKTRKWGSVCREVGADEQGEKEEVKELESQ